MSLSILNSNILFKSVYKFLNTIKQQKKTTKQILEPLTTIVILAIISFKEIGTKIAVSSNEIYIQPPTMIQGPVRWTYGNNREEIHFLLKPIIRAILIYNPKDNPDIKKIFLYAIKGLNILKQSYNNFSSTLCHAIELYINLINYSFEHTEITQKYKDVENSLNSNLNLSQNTKINLNNLFVGIWSTEEINLISNMLELCNNNTKYIEVIETTLGTKKNKIREIIKNTLQIF